MNSSPVISEQLLRCTSSGIPNGDAARGPTPTCCWLVPGLVLWGEAPRGPRLAAIIDAGAVHFLDLRSAATAGDYLGSNTSGIRYQHLDLPKLLGTTSAASVETVASTLKGALAESLVQSKDTPRCILYVHCEDGTTLSGIAAAGILAYIYGLSALKAAAVAAQLHGSRADANQGKVALTASQKAFLKELCLNQLPIALPTFAEVVPSSPTAPSAHNPMPQQGFNSSTPMDQNRPNTSMNVSMNASQMGAGSTPEPNRRGSRFQHSSGTGGGLTTLNLFHGEPANNTTPQATPTKSLSRLSIPPPMLQVSAVSLPIEQQQQQQLVHHTPSAGSRRSDGSRSPVSSLAISPSRGAMSQSPQRAPVVVDGGLQVLHLQRPSLAHAWGLILSHGGRTIQYVLPCSPAEVSGCAPGMELRAVGNGDFMEGDYFDWVARDHLSVTVTVLVCVTEESTPPSSSHYHPSDSNRSQRNHNSSTNNETGMFAPPPLLDPRSEASLVRGPTPTSNWVVRDLVLCGPAPLPRLSTEFEALVAARIDLFVVLTEEPPTYIEAYHKRMQAIDRQATIPRVLHCPMTTGVPFSEATGAEVMKLVNTILQELSLGRTRRVYLHCFNGHGRTGIIVSALLALLYQLPPVRALALCNALHNCRVNTEDQTSPQTDKEKRFVTDLLTQQRIVARHADPFLF